MCIVLSVVMGPGLSFLTRSVTGFFAMCVFVLFSVFINSGMCELFRACYVYTVVFVMCSEWCKLFTHGKVNTIKKVSQISYSAQPDS